MSPTERKTPHGKHRILTSTLLAGAVALVAGIADAQIPYRCPLAPKHGVLCKYVDPRRYQALLNEALIEGARWAVVQASMPAIQKVVDGSRLGGVKLVQYDTALRRMMTPRAGVPVTFAAAWNLSHPTAAVRVQARSGQLVTINAAALSDSAVRELQAGDDPAHITDASIRRLAQRSSVGGNSTELSTQFALLYDRAKQAEDTNKAQIDAANRLAARARATSSGMQGESEAQILAAKGTFDLLRGLAEAQRGEGADAMLRGLRAAQQSRTLKRHAIAELSRQRLGGGRP